MQYSIDLYVHVHVQWNLLNQSINQFLLSLSLRIPLSSLKVALCSVLTILLTSSHFLLPFLLLSPLRLKVALDAVDPRIHFALVCGAKSCPPIRTYSASVRLLLFLHVHMYIVSNKYILLRGISGNNSQYCPINHVISCLLPSSSSTWC